MEDKDLGNKIKDYIDDSMNSPFEGTSELKKRREEIYQGLIEIGGDECQIFRSYIPSLNDYHNVNKILQNYTNQLIYIADALIKNAN